jgi:hypothetical protein
VCVGSLVRASGFELLESVVLCVCAHQETSPRLRVGMETPRVVRPTISAKEWNERRYITKVVNATIHYAQSKLAGFPFDAQTERYGDVWRVVLTIKWTPQPPAPKIIPTFEDVGCVDGRL